MAEDAEQLLKTFADIAGTRGVFESHWDEIARRVWPAMSGQFNQNGMGRTPGEKRTEDLLDSTASIALGRFAAVVESLLTPQARWHRVVASNHQLMRSQAVRRYFETLTDALFKHRMAPKANFSSQNGMNFRMLGAFGTGTMFTDALREEPGLRYKSVHIGEIYFCENHQGIIDQAWRRFPFTARQAKQRWGEKLPEQVRNAKNDSEIFWFVHCVKPREDRDPQRVDYKGMPFVSYYLSETGRALLEEGGYTSFPYAISRYWQGPGEVYGRSPAMDVLPAIKTLNEEKKVVLKQGHRNTDPVLLLHNDGVLDGFSLKPGALNSGAVNASGQPLVHTLPVGNIAIGKELMDDERLVINDAFLVTLFQILVETPTMTATEVLERVREKGMLLAPTVGRQQSEYLGPLIEREIDVLAHQGLLPQMPPELVEARGEYMPIYDSPMSRSMRAEEASGLMRTVEAALNIVNVSQNPEPLDHFDWDVIIPEIAEIQGVPLRWLRLPEVVGQLRSQRAEAARRQEEMQAAPGQAALIKSAAVAQKEGVGVGQ